jgi:hypothetical protein
MSVPYGGSHDGMFLYPEEIDQRLSWPLGRAARLARRQQLPHVVLPDGSIRFEWPTIEAMVKRVPLDHSSEAEGGDK